MCMLYMKLARWGKLSVLNMVRDYCPHTNIFEVRTQIFGATGGVC